MYYTYIIESIRYKIRYVGSTHNLEKRIRDHNEGMAQYTKSRGPWKLICQEQYATRSEAVRREKFLKTGKGREYLANYLKNFGSVREAAKRIWL